MGYSNKWKRWTKDDVVQAAPKDGSSIRDDGCSQNAAMT
jgi:hypothetical protein